MKKWLSKICEKFEDFFIWLFYGDHKMLYGRVEIPLKGEKWDLHVGDADPFPSVPHLHSAKDNRMKIDVYTGEVYLKKINIGKIKDKEFFDLWHDEKFLKDVIKARSFYLQNYPNYRLPDPPDFL